MLAISMDTPDDSRAFARDYGIEFPLLSDPDGAVSRVYAGVTSDANTLPGVTIIRGDGRIVFRQVASAKDDRISSAELIAAVDRTLGTTGPAVADAGYAALDRLQLRIDAGGGAVDNGGWRATGLGAVSALVPLGHHAMFGPRASFEPRDAPVAVDGVLELRLPIVNDAGAIELGFSAGWTPWRASGFDAGATAGVWFAMAPTWALQVNAGVTAHRLDGDVVPEITLTFGATRLIRIR